MHHAVPLYGLDRSVIHITSRYSFFVDSPVTSPKVILNLSQLRSVLAAYTRDKCLAFSITHDHAERIVEWVLKVYRKEVIRNPIDHCSGIDHVYLYQAADMIPDVGYIVGQGRSSYSTFGMFDSYEMRAIVELYENQDNHDYDIQAVIDPSKRRQPEVTNEEKHMGDFYASQRAPAPGIDSIPVKAQFYWYENGDDVLSDLLDFLIHNEVHMPKDVSRMSYADADTAKDLWHKQLDAAKQREFAKMPKGERLVLQPEESADYDVTLLLDEAALIYEGVKQHHCVASYWIPVQAKRTLIVNFRNKETGVEFTGEVARPYRMATDKTATVTMSQLRGTCNANPSDEAKQAMVLSLNACMPALAKYVNETAVEKFEVGNA